MDQAAHSLEVSLVLARGAPTIQVSFWNSLEGKDVSFIKQKSKVTGMKFVATEAQAFLEGREIRLLKVALCCQANS